MILYLRCIIQIMWWIGFTPTFPIPSPYSGYAGLLRCWFFDMQTSDSLPVLLLIPLHLQEYVPHYRLVFVPQPLLRHIPG